ncbi:MAG: ABC transporter ATP-binding protein [Erysipelotrichaceae bacterium]|nr:ABC transporter ATP-binding protein [Erysipelotrichaceae bacterium]
MNNILEIEKLNVVYRIPEGRRHVLRDVSLELKKGEIMAVVGESGCGKSTLVNTIISLLPSNAMIESGRIIIDGKDITNADSYELSSVRRNRLGVVFQDPFSALDPLYTIEKQFHETIRLTEKLSKAESHDKAAAMLRACGIKNAEEIMKKYPHELSGGLRQRVMIAMALINDPTLVIADEPTTALDVTIQKEILQLLRTLARERQLTVLFITHSLDIAFEIADRITVFYGGRIVEQGTRDDLFSFPLHPYTQALLNTIPSIRYGKNERKLMPIEGEIFSFLNETEGCSFAPRCPYARESCFNKAPEIREYNGHKCACEMEEKW